jgi:hypothetical protein
MVGNGDFSYSENMGDQSDISAHGTRNGGRGKLIRTYQYISGDPFLLQA